MTVQYTNKLLAGAEFPMIKVPLYEGGERVLGHVEEGFDWQLVVIYRGRHCPLCTKYLNQLQDYKAQLAALGVSIIAVSGDSKAQLEQHIPELKIDLPLAYGLTTDDMKILGTYISDPRSAQETDHPFAEPALYVVNERGTVQVVDISNNPFVRPDLDSLVNGLAWIKNPDNNYPIRGMHS
ncbi:redoxin domain-containing protein [Endozoicomonas sp. G2_1]|uniref:peroxiredoxin family protein n=1 Tax=Endozoicomonas sp. G2_1 TaxID=2821091 RepID=UPI001AD9AE50|nr:redoxin domain-containing protein [Endozoicomonas sp. G2_1]MBO9491615.1 redoxin domain-containing protein [Endozoicomonas sp. G2_1]